MASHRALTILRAIPLLGFVLVLANLFALLADGFATGLLKFGMPSSAQLTLTAGDLVALSGLLLLCVEMYKMRQGAINAIDRFASATVLLLAMLEFLFLAPFSDGRFLTFIVMILVDVINGFTYGRKGIEKIDY